MAASSVPVVVLAGYLGSGKTTLLNHLLRNRRGLRIGVMVNDFGAVNVDALQVAGQVDRSVSLSNGCICCAVDGDELADALSALVSGAELDLVVIEASGIAEPASLIRMIVSADSPRIRYGGLVYLVDMVGLADTTARHPGVVRHLRHADLILLTKSDLATDEQCAAAEDFAAEANPTAPRLACVDGNLDPAMLVDVPERAPVVGEQLGFDELLGADHHDCDDHSDHMHAQYQSVDFTDPRPFDPRRLTAWLEQPPAGVLRVKGFLGVGVPGYGNGFLVQTVGSYITVADAGRDAPASTQLVVIGAGIDVDGVRASLAACQQGAGDSPDEQGMLGFLRYRR
ncbi:CobW family GTP-binding protein [Jongsikchunia kroppenstedtii]|uniref:CobW family GTP-binding protein n=1 Tax=Jongsikchunia kroppenstedtii TaxID=1121721 RepID=UPI000379971D|nr:GTP-binding protein [Jongsikchunia kroppenstedtii]